MNNCTKYIEQMNMYLDGELKGSRISELLEHIERCPNCKNRFEALKIISFQTREMDISVPQDLHDKIMRNVRTNARPAKKNFGMHKFVSFAAVAAVFLIVMSTVFSGFTPSFSKEEALTSAPAANVKAVSIETGNTLGGAVYEPDTTAATEAVAETIEDVHTDTFAFLKLFTGNSDLPGFVSEYEYEQDADSQLYYVYVENNPEVFKAFEEKLTDAGFVDGGELKNTSNIDENAAEVLYIINVK